MDLFADLPEPTNNESQSPTCKASDGAMRKRSRDDNPVEQVSVSSPKQLKIGLDTASSPVNIYKLFASYSERKGEREEMQDAHTIVNDFKSHLENISNSTAIDDNILRMSYYAVFDGHAGARAAQFAAKNLHRNVALLLPVSSLAKLESDMKRCFVDAFKKTDEEFLKAAASCKPSWKDGSTAIVVFAVNNVLYIANLGDSKAVICRQTEGKYYGIPLSDDHNPEIYEERQRIQKAGGNVKEGRVLGILEVSRSLGDGQYKKHGVTCIPDLKRCQLTDDDRYLVIACDGLWKAFTTESAIEFINKIMGDEMTLEKLDEGCTKICTEAVKRLSGDNVTVVLVGIKRDNNSIL